MTPLEIVFAVFAVITGVGGFYVGQKRNSHDDGQNMGVFIGEVKAKLEYIQSNIDRLSLEFARDREERAAIFAEMREEFSKMISEALAVHEKLYHKEER